MRHQNHHTGTTEDTARATAKTPARGAQSLTRAVGNRGPGSDDEQPLNNGPIVSAPLPAHRTMPRSPTAEIASMSTTSDQYVISFLPVHLRGDQHVPSPTS